MQPTDDQAAVLLDVEHRSLSDSDYAVGEAVALLKREEQHAYLANGPDGPAGFCACFDTDMGQTARLEIDLLGVVPAWRNRGVARRLVAHVLSEGRNRGVHAARGVVREDNVASRRVFLRCGFRASARCTMMVYVLHGHHPRPFLPKGWLWKYTKSGTLELHDGGKATAGSQHAVHWLEHQGALMALATSLCVHTLCYRGIWLERLWAPMSCAVEPMASAVLEQAKELGVDEVGHLVDDQRHPNLQHTLEAMGWQAVAKYDVMVWPG